MSEIKITIDRVSTSKGEGAAVVVTTKRGWIRSPAADRMAAWHLRDLVRALDAQGVPGTAKVTASKSDSGHTTGLTVEWSEPVEES